MVEIQVRMQDGDIIHTITLQQEGSLRIMQSQVLIPTNISSRHATGLADVRDSTRLVYMCVIISIIAGVARNMVVMLKTWILYTLVLLSWLCIVPITAARIYNVVFYNSLYDILALPGLLFRTDNVLTDICKVGG